MTAAAFQPESMPERYPSDSDMRLVTQPVNELSAVQSYRANVIGRTSVGDVEITATGARIYRELVHFEDSDGRQVSRLATIGEPGKQSTLGAQSSIPISATDPWLTGPNGLNHTKTMNYVDRGFPVVWLHHGSRDTAMAPDKSISRSAHQQHGYLDALSETAEFNTDIVIGDGYSRGAMTLEKFIALATLYGRKVPVSDSEAPCFVHDMSQVEKLITLATQVPGEALGLGRLAIKTLQQALVERDPSIVTKQLGTFDVHPKNVAQEALWIRALIRSNLGSIMSEIPLNTVGVRTFFRTDRMSQQADFQTRYDSLPNITVVTERGPHVAGAYPEYLDKKYERFGKILGYIVEHDGLDGIQASNIVTLDSRRQSRHWWQNARPLAA